MSGTQLVLGTLQCGRDVPTSLPGREKVREGVSSKESILDQDAVVRAPGRAGCVIRQGLHPHTGSDKFESGRRRTVTSGQTAGAALG